MQQWFTQAPANIALIKYMGKMDDNTNLPANPSLSYTLPHLLSNVMLETHAGKKDFWEPLYIPGALEFHLSSHSQSRYLGHLEYLKSYFGYSGSFIVRSSNNFPYGSGLASSASSFAALTKCAVLALCELTNISPPSTEVQAHLSRLGSGSSCRSFFEPWALWDNEQISAISLPYEKLLHEVIIISHDEKAVSSSEAHRRVRTSPLYAERSVRAILNLKLLLEALHAHDWKNAYQICWHEFYDMHQLFSTCDQPFSYMTENTHQVLNALRTQWELLGDGPIITMDAGPNIHLLYRLDQADMARQFKQDFLIGNYDVL